MNSVFNEQILADKLSKLNSTQQCIETLSHWCIFHREKAELVVSTWDKQFHSSEIAQKIPFLYLANDILQNSKRKGNEFVSEFWKVLPAALKDVFENGDEHGKNTVSRLVGIWEERRVFGSRAESLKDLMLGKESLPPLEFGKKRSRSVKIVKRDSRSVRIKLTIGGTTEKIVSAFHSVLSEHQNEDLYMNKCKSAVHRVRKMEKEFDAVYPKIAFGHPKRTTLANELEEEETLLKQAIEKLKSVKETRATLVSQLKEALLEQESELENIRTQLQVAQAQAEEACIMRKRLNNEAVDISAPKPSALSTPPKLDSNVKAGDVHRRSAADIAAEVADKLAASSSSQQIMTSVLSTFAAQEAKNAGLVPSTPSNSFTSIPSNSFGESRRRLEKPMAVLDPNVFVSPQPIAVAASNPYQTQTVLMHQTSIPSHVSPSPPQYHFIPNAPSQQYSQPTGGVMSGIAYGYNNMLPPPPPSLPGPPPPAPHMQQPMNLTAPMVHQQHSSLMQQPPARPSYRPLQPPAVVYYAHPHQPH
ncbi:hypothetical protein Scep_001967 [Stephania cephalantha]|uniref:CID domain-containing protein n=1 Tax=Stephania cephalantha TaxID=152367 RepID=A0AAP0L992_9MAGN